MHAFPHRYKVTGRAGVDGDVILSSPELPDIASQPPREFDGPGDRWSPESLLTAAVADCFILGFRAITAASRMPFTQLDVEVEGVLDMA
ncbi:MAG: OsmC family protein, partial [Gammaproteobacteria bacterium]|nr:OsmC family protein [Gammaproteobacteria bacterium]